jgi:hypothetical protein
VIFASQTHRHINVFENLTPLDTPAAIARFDQVVARPATMLSSESILECEGVIDLLRFHEEACSVDFPCCRCFAHVYPPLGREGLNFLQRPVDRISGLSGAAKFLFAGFFMSRVMRIYSQLNGAVNSKFLVQLKNCLDLGAVNQSD